MAKMASTRQLSLDGLRGIAALAVVLYHYFYRLEEILGTYPDVASWAYYGKYGVHLFFMISGYVIFMSINKETKARGFIISRFSRLYPTFFFAVIITFIIVKLAGLEGREVKVYEALLNLLMFHEYLGVPHVDGVYWTLTVEITFYFWCFITILFNKNNCLPFLLLSFLFFSFSAELLPQTIYKALGKIFITKYVSFFILGMFTYKLIKDKEIMQSMAGIIVSFLVLILKSETNEFYVYILIYILFFLGVINMLKAFENAVFVFLGGISYSLYLLHQNIGYVIINNMTERGFDKLFSIFFALTLSIFLAWLMHKLVEVKLSKVIKTTLHKWF